MSKYCMVWFFETQTIKSLLLLWKPHAAGSKLIEKRFNVVN